VYRAYKALREEKAAGLEPAPVQKQELEEEVVSR
jgi:hypothetical protein